MQKSAPLLGDPLRHVRQPNGAGHKDEETSSSSPLTGWYAELLRLIPKQTRKAVRKTLKKAIMRHGPEIATAIVTGVVTSVLTAASTPTKKKKKKKKKH